MSKSKKTLWAGRDDSGYRPYGLFWEKPVWSNWSKKSKMFKWGPKVSWCDEELWRLLGGISLEAGECQPITVSMRIKKKVKA